MGKERQGLPIPPSCPYPAPPDLVPEGHRLTDARPPRYGTNAHANGDGGVENPQNLSFDSTDITVSWLDETITEDAPSYELRNDATTPVESTVNTKGIFFEELSHSVRIKVATVSPVEFDSLDTYFALNKAYVHSDEGEIGKPIAVTDQFTATEYRFKKSGTYDQANNVATWTVEINKGFLEVNPDFAPYFTDRVPANMELIDGEIKVTGYIGNIYNVQINNQSFTANVIDNVIQPIYIGEKNQYENLIFQRIIIELRIRQR